MQQKKVLDEKHVILEESLAGWARAMGQNQFPLYTFNNFTVDYDEDGRKDIWSKKLDFWTSVANYLQ